MEGCVLHERIHNHIGILFLRRIYTPERLVTLPMWCCPKEILVYFSLNYISSEREQKLKVREQVKALNEVEQTVREWLNSDAVEGLDRTAKPVFD